MELNSSPSDRTPRQQAFDLYWKIQAQQPLTPREQRLAQGHSIFSDSPEDLERGKQLVKKLGVRVAQLADCWICHR